MKILCAKSGIIFSVDHLPGFLTSREISHPVFSLPSKRLLALSYRYLEGRLDDVDSYLLFCGLLNDTNLMQYSVPFARTEESAGIIARNMTSLVTMAQRIHATPRPEKVYASVHVSPETKDLEGAHVWIGTWQNNWEDYQNGWLKQKVAADMAKREGILQRWIKDSTRDASKYSPILARWAADAGDFPKEQITNPISKQQQSRSAYWQEIIISCTRKESIFNYPKEDIRDMFDSVQNIPAGSIYQHDLVRIVREAIHRRDALLNLGDADLLLSTYRILPGEGGNGANNAATVTANANIMAMIDSAPPERPLRASYPSEFAFLKAKMRWEQKEKYGEAMAKIAVPISSGSGSAATVQKADSTVNAGNGSTNL